MTDSREPSKARIDSIDLLRGIVMVVMMLDHTRDFVHSGAAAFRSNRPDAKPRRRFFSRAGSHTSARRCLCFSPGRALIFSWRAARASVSLSKFLVTRGLWLIVLEFTVVRFGATFSFDYRFLGMMQVIWVIGVSMIVLAALIHLPLKVVAGFGFAMIALHNLLDSFEVAGWQGPGSPVPGMGAKLWIILHQPFNVFPIAGFPSPVVVVIYPLIPWVGVMALGYAFGSLYQKDAQETTALANHHGRDHDGAFRRPARHQPLWRSFEWSSQKNALFTLFHF